MRQTSIISFFERVRRTCFLALALGSVVLGIPSNVHAQSEGKYRIGNGDVLDVRVLGEAEFSGTFRVASDGTIDFPYLRKIAVLGESVEGLETKVVALLQNGYLASPQVSVSVKEYRSQKVLVLGAVTRPGTYPLQDQTRLLDVITQAGGILGTGAKKILLIRGEDLRKAGLPEPMLALASAPPQSSAAPSSAEEAFVSPPAEASVDASTASLRLVLASSRVKPVMIDYYKLTTEGDFSQNVLLQNGDILNIPRRNEVFVLGNVGKPGPVPFDENMMILQAVTLAGGPTPTASTKSTYVLRQTEKGEEKIKVRFDKILENKEKNFLLKPDDVIVVPESFF